ncbi:MAG: YkoP family protein [Anaerolineae bacterium]
MRRLIAGFDVLLRRLYGVFEFDSSDDCLFRLQWRRAHAPVVLSDGVWLNPGDCFLELHLWNEHVPPLPRQGADLAWGQEAGRRLRRSLSALAEFLANEGSSAKALHAASVLTESDRSLSPPAIMIRLGFEPGPYRNPLGPVGVLAVNFYSYLLMRAFNPPSLRGRLPWHLCRQELWMSRQRFLLLHGDVKGSRNS